MKPQVANKYIIITFPVLHFNIQLMSVILITGGTGLVGTALTGFLTDKGYDVIVLSRKASKSENNRVSYAQWNIEQQTIDAGAVSKADYIIHLAGAGIAEKKWSKARKKELVESRTHSSALLVKALHEIPNKVKAVVSASAIGWYGPDLKRHGHTVAFTEDMKPDEGFLGETCRLWEESIAGVEKQGRRLVTLRLGIVISNEGGALAEFKKPLKFGIAGVLGKGKQVISWIHIADLCRMFLFALENETLRGVYNAVAPNPVTNKELTLALAEKLRGRFFIPVHVPAFIIKALFGELSLEVLKSTTVSSQKIKSAGFTFVYPQINAAL